MVVQRSLRSLVLITAYVLAVTSFDFVYAHTLIAGGTPTTHILELQLQEQLVVSHVTFGDGSTLAVLIDTGSGNLAVPSSRCRSLGCQGKRRFYSEDDESGMFLGADLSDIHLSFASARVSGSGFEGRVCLGDACGRVGFVVAVEESDAFQGLGFDGILGLGLPRQAAGPGFNVLGALAHQGALPAATLMLSLRSQGNSSGALGVRGEALAAAPIWFPADTRHGEWAVRLSEIYAGAPHNGGTRGGACSNSSACRAVLDSGCPGIVLPPDAFKLIRSDLDLGGCSHEEIMGLPSLRFVLGAGRVFEVPPERYVEVSTEDTGRCKLLVESAADSTTRTALLGVPFLLDKDIVFDQDHMKVGIADARIGKTTPATTTPLAPTTYPSQAHRASALGRFLG